MGLPRRNAESDILSCGDRPGQWEEELGIVRAFQGWRRCIGNSVSRSLDKDAFSADEGLFLRAMM